MTRTPDGFLFGPFCFHSEIDLAPLRFPRCAAANVPSIPVSVRLGRVGDTLEEPGLVALNASVEASPALCVLRIPGTGAFAVAEGCRVVVDLVAGAALEDVRSYLTGWVFGVLCHQNGMLPLHGSAVAGEDGVTAFLGDSGAGKSTLAAALARRGHPVVADDICLLARRADGLRVVPVAAWLKLWRGSLEHLGATSQPQDRTFADEDKYRIPLPDTPLHGEKPGPILRHLVFLAREPEVPRLTPRSNAETLAGMLRTVYLGYMAEAMGLERRLFQLGAATLATAQGYTLCAPWDLHQLETVAEFVEGRLLTLMSRS